MYIKCHNESLFEWDLISNRGFVNTDPLSINAKNSFSNINNHIHNQNDQHHTSLNDFRVTFEEKVIADAIEKGLANWRKLNVRQKLSKKRGNGTRRPNTKSGLTSEDARKLLKRNLSRRGVQNVRGKHSIKISRKRRTAQAKHEHSTRVNPKLTPVERIQEEANESRSQTQDEEITNHNMRNEHGDRAQKQDMFHRTNNSKQRSLLKSRSRKPGSRKNQTPNQKHFGSVKRIKPRSSKVIRNQAGKLEPMQRPVEVHKNRKTQKSKKGNILNDGGPTQVVFAQYMRSLIRKRTSNFKEKENVGKLGRLKSLETSESRLLDLNQGNNDTPTRAVNNNQQKNQVKINQRQYNRSNFLEGKNLQNLKDRKFRSKGRSLLNLKKRTSNSVQKLMSNGKKRARLEGNQIQQKSKIGRKSSLFGNHRRIKSLHKGSKTVKHMKIKENQKDFGNGAMPANINKYEQNLQVNRNLKGNVDEGGIQFSNPKIRNLLDSQKGRK